MMQEMQFAIFDKDAIFDGVMEKNFPVAVLLTTDFPPMLGGISEHLSTLIERTSGHIHWRVYTTVEPPGPGKKEPLVPAVRLKGRRPASARGNGAHIGRRLTSVFHHLANPRRARMLISDILEHDQPDLILMGCWDYQTSYWCRACRSAGLPYAIFAHGTEIVSGRPWPMAGRRADDFRGAAVVIANSRATLDKLRNRGETGKNSFILYPFLSADFCASAIAREAPSQLPPPLRNGERYILSVGRLIPRKGFDIVLEAFALLGGEYPDVHCVIAGEGPERKALERILAANHLEGRVHLQGMVSDREKTALLQGCELFVMPNRESSDDTEGYGIVFLEAGFCQKAVIGGKHGGVPEAVEDGVTGILIPSPGPGAVADAIRRLLRSPDLRARLGAEARSRIIARGQDGRPLEDFVHLVRSRGVKVNPHLAS